MKMTFDDYINNPMGKENAVMSNREMFRNLYTEKLDKILVRETGKVTYKLYVDKEEYFIHMKVPSEVIDKFYYDTVIQFYPKDNTSTLERTLKNYNIKFYSNDPSFVFTFAHAMLENDLFIRDLTPRMSKEAVKNVAKEKNPKNTIGYVKSLYFAYLLMRRYGLFSKIEFESYGLKYNRKALLSEIEHADKKIESRQEEGKKLTKTKKPSIKKSTNIHNSSDDIMSSSNVKLTTRVGQTNIVKKTTSTILNKHKNSNNVHILKKKK